MPTPTEISCFAVLQAAASAPLGIIVRTNNPVKARASLYKCRNMLNDPTLAALSIRVSPDNSEAELWLLSNRQAGLTFDVGKL